MFGLFKKKEVKPLYIHAKDVFSIIKSDYDEGCAFCLVDFLYQGRTYTMGSSLLPNTEERQENIIFVFNEHSYRTFEEFAQNSVINGVNLSESSEMIEITRAGIIDGDAAISSPWDDTRLEKFAIKE